MTWIEWYKSLTKPSSTPEPSTIGMIWQILYPIILVTFGFVAVQIPTDGLQAAETIESGYWEHWPTVHRVLDKIIAQH